jgi:N4-gp56 family major capsid protein
MSLNSFIPTIWSNELLVSLKKALIAGQPNVANRNYEGTLRAYGDTVKINAIGPVTIGNYTKNTQISDPEVLDDAQTTLTITEQKYFNFFIDDIDRAQQFPKTIMAQAMQEAAYGLANVADQFLLGLLAANSVAGNTIGTTASPKTVAASTDVYDYLVDLKVMLDIANVPTMGRWAIVPPWVIGEMLKDARFNSSLESVGPNVLLNGAVGRAAGFDILTSNNLTKEGTGAVGEYYHIHTGTSMALSFAEQISEVEAYRPEKQFANAVKGLHVYGGKVVRPEALANLIVDRPA